MSKIILLLYVSIASLGLVALKFGTNHEEAPGILVGKFPIVLNIYTIAGILMYGISFLLYILLISKNDLSYIIPMAAALIYILIFIASYFIFKESFTVVKIIGIILILVGIIFVNLSKNS